MRNCEGLRWLWGLVMWVTGLQPHEEPSPSAACSVTCVRWVPAPFRAGRSPRAGLRAHWGQRQEGDADAAGFADVQREPAARAVAKDHITSTKLPEKNTLMKVFSY